MSDGRRVSNPQLAIEIVQRFAQGVDFRHLYLHLGQLPFQGSYVSTQCFQFARVGRNCGARRRCFTRHASVSLGLSVELRAELGQFLCLVEGMRDHTAATRGG